MVSKRQIHTQFAETLDAKADRARYQNAILGHPDRTVYITERPGYVWARLGGANGQIIQLYARGLMAGYNMPVVIQRLPHRPQDYGIVDLDISAWPSQASGDNTGGWDGSAYVGKHANQHWYFGGDPLLVHLRAFTPLRVYAAGGMYIGVQPGIIPRAGVDLNITGQVISLIDEIPLVSGQQRYSLITLDSNGLLAVTRGTAVTGLMGLSLANVPDTPAGHFRLAAVRCYYGQTSINESATSTDIIDLRWPQESIAGSPYALFGTQAANTVLAGPTTGAAALPSFRALVAADLPAHDIVSAHSTSGRTAGQVLQATGAAAFGWSTNTLTIAGNSTINGSLVGNITGGGTLATGGFTGTIPESMTFAGRNVANTFTVGPQTVNTGADANKGIIAKANSATQTGNLIEVQNSGGTGLSAFSGAGNLRIGSATVRDGAGLEVTKTITSTAQDPTLSYYYGLRTTASASPTGNTVSDWRLYGLDLTAQANNANNITGQIIAAQFAGQINMTGGTLTSLYGGLFANNGINASGTATTTSTFAGRFQLGKSGAGTWSIGTASLLSVGKPSVSAGTLTGTTLYGINIEDMNGANSGTWSNRYAVNSAGGRWVLANTADEVLLSLTGFSTQATTTALQTLTRNDANTNAIGMVLTLSHNSTGTAAAGFGGAIALNLESSTTADQSAAALEWLWATATHASRKARIIGKVYDTAARTWLQVDTDGSTSDVLINSLIYGSMYGDDISQLVTVDASSTYYEVGGGLTGGNANGMTFQNSKELLVTVAGKYLVTWSMSLSAGNNDHLEGAVMINSTVAPSTENAAHTPGAGDQVPVGGSGILTLAVNDLVKLCVENETDTDDITVSHATLTAVRIGE